MQIIDVLRDHRRCLASAIEAGERKVAAPGLSKRAARQALGLRSTQGEWDENAFQMGRRCCERVAVVELTKVSERLRGIDRTDT